MKVFIYFNLHKRCFSVKALSGPQKGRVVAHTSAVVLADASFKVSAAGRARVLAEKRKNVHAGVVGTWHSAYVGLEYAPADGVKVIYNPYKYTSFVEQGNGNAVYNAPMVVMDIVNNIPSVIKYPVLSGPQWLWWNR